MNKEIKDIAMTFFNTARENLFIDGSLITTFFVKEEGGKIHIIGAEWANDSQKAEMTAMVSAFAKSINAQWVMFLGEVWTATVDYTHPATRGISRVSELPNKEEVLMLVVMEPDGKCNIVSSKIKRATNGEPYTEHPDWEFDDDKFKNLQMNMIQPWR